MEGTPREGTRPRWSERSGAAAAKDVTRRTTLDIRAAFGICGLQMLSAEMEESVKAQAELPDSYPPSRLSPAVPSGDERTRQGDFDRVPWGLATKHH